MKQVICDKCKKAMLSEDHFILDLSHEIYGIETSAPLSAYDLCNQCRLEIFTFPPNYSNCEYEEI